MPEPHTRSSLGAFALPPEFVQSEKIFLQEIELLFDRHWLCVGRVEQIYTNNCITVSHGDYKLLIVNDDGEIRCFHNTCRHRGSLLVEDMKACDRIGQRIQCPYHAWTYARNGELVSAPNMEGVEGFSREQFGLRKVDCRTALGFIWIRIAEEGSDFDDFFAPLWRRLEPWQIEDLRIGRTIEYQVQANWKLIFQNYSECYHCPGVHPALNRLTPYKGSSNDLDDGPILGGPMNLSDDCQSMTTDGNAVAEVLPGLDEARSRSVAYFTICPTAFISPHPDYVLVHRLVPVSVSETVIVCNFLFHPDAIHTSDFDPQPAVDFWDQTNLQDWHVCELTQRGMTTPGYQPGPYSNLESIVAAFDRYYYKVMSGSIEL